MLEAHCFAEAFPNCTIQIKTSFGHVGQLIVSNDTPPQTALLERSFFWPDSRLVIGDFQRIHARKNVTLRSRKPRLRGQELIIDLSCLDKLPKNDEESVKTAKSNSLLPSRSTLWPTLRLLVLAPTPPARFNSFTYANMIRRLDPEARVMGCFFSFVKV
jgi:hypothetical protein